MKEYKKLLMEIFELEEDIVRTSGGINNGGGDSSGGGSSSGGGGAGGGDSSLDDSDPANKWDDLLPDFGNN